MPCYQPSPWYPERIRKSIGRHVNLLGWGGGERALLCDCFNHGSSSLYYTDMWTRHPPSFTDLHSDFHPPPFLCPSTCPLCLPDTVAEKYGVHLELDMIFTRVPFFGLRKISCPLHEKFGAIYIQMIGRGGACHWLRNFPP